MKKWFVPGVVAVALLTTLLPAGCSGGSTGKYLSLEKKIADNMTLEQVNALLSPDLKQASILYQTEKIELTPKGSWVVTSKEGGYKTGETGPYQVLFFTPAKAGEQYLMVFFKNNVTVGKSWFTSQGAVIIEKILKGEKLY
jgi:hypothetical protein